MIFIEYPMCTTCKKAKKFLDDNNLKYVDRNIKENNPTYEELEKWYKISKLPLKSFFNTSGLIYRENNLKEKLPKMTEKEQLKLLSSNGMLVKRPILITESNIILGYKENEYKKIKD